ncbi:hypothetical protein PROFUN_10136 [Planoprotostelium fungivorum]|uniref:Uncharacterized protein n=1 Tax=Planoprotostelium fungivorum TaxID=1890364 RepID=A0A2P6NEP7_9EUKA|nr:hypothetical protein PROFUN_10136 [Planoprotostelium fungivorum]
MNCKLFCAQSMLYADWVETSTHLLLAEPQSDRSQIDPSRKANLLINGGHGTEENYQKAAALEGGPCYRSDSYVPATDYSRWHGPADRLFHSTNHVHRWQKKRNVVFGRIYLVQLNSNSWDD